MTGLRRRDFLKGAAVASATAAIAGATQATNSPTDGSVGGWTTYRGNARRTGATDAAGPGRNVGTEWSMDPGGGMHAVEPVVADGTLYLAVTTAHTPSTSEGYVAAHDLATGEQRWKQDGLSRPATPTVGDGTVYVDTGGAEFADATGFFALDAETGETRWQRPASDGVGGVLVADGRLYGTAAGDACELDPSTGEFRWRTSGVDGTACYADGSLFFGSGVALDAADGTVRWDVSDEVGGEWDLDVVQTVVDGVAYGTLYRESKEVQARSAADGTLQWSHSLDTDARWWSHQLAVTDDHVVFRFGDTVNALDAKTGEQAWAYDAAVELTSTPTMASGTVYVGGRTDPGSDTGDAVVLAFDAETGQRAWKHVFGAWDFEDYGPAATTPVVADGRVVAATYPEGATTDYLYTDLGDVHVLGSRKDEAGEGTTTEEPTTTPRTTTEPTTTTSRTSSGSTSTTRTTDAPGTTGQSTAGAPSATSTATTGTRSTAGATTTAPGTGTTQSTTDGQRSATVVDSTTTTDGQVGFGVLSALVGLAGVGAHLRSKRGGEGED